MVQLPGLHSKFFFVMLVFFLMILQLGICQISEDCKPIRNVIDNDFQISFDLPHCDDYSISSFKDNNIYHLIYKRNNISELSVEITRDSTYGQDFRTRIDNELYNLLINNYSYNGSGTLAIDHEPNGMWVKGTNLTQEGRKKIFLRYLAGHLGSDYVCTIETELGEDVFFGPVVRSFKTKIL